MNICLYIHFHETKKLNNYTMFDVGEHTHYFNKEKTKEEINKKTENFYKPLLEEIEKENIKANISITGVMLELLEEYNPNIITKLRELKEKEKIEFIGETYYHSLSFLHSKKEFSEQLNMQLEKVEELFGEKPIAFKNTELIYTNPLGKELKKQGLKAVLAEGKSKESKKIKHNYVYESENLKLLFKNNHISKKITEKNILEEITNEEGDILNIFLEKNKNFKNIKDNLYEISPDHKFVTIKDIIKEEPKKNINIESKENWASNNIQNSALEKIFSIEESIKKAGIAEILNSWRHLTTKENLDLMSNSNLGTDKNPYEAFINYRNIVKDMEERIAAEPYS